ncbi:MAG: DMT family transporter [Proteobacteria bacterium]|nr:DMT family transporter [Pseudomonadota bacterium]MBU1583927.1 DMT family transporter [Pseudomonadota bacterium]MBU2454317.1 DMT family transporter [Pseudomonadota bacterium]MBU2627392.1 DMT family transporter [Pseudomonadota bacterium]
MDIKRILPILSILGAVFLWGSSFSAMRILLRDLSPTAVMFCRLFIAVIFILPISGKIFSTSYQKGDWKILLPMVLFQPCLYFLFESNALTFTTSSQAGIISACLPLMVAVAAWFFLSESMHRKIIIGLILSIFGVVLLTLFQGEQVNAPHPVLGNFLELCAMASACANIILIKKLSSRYSTWDLTRLQVCAGMLFFLPGIRSVILADPSIWTLKTILLLLYLGVFVSFLSFGLYNWGVSKVAASRASIFINLIPVTAVLLGWLVLGETLNTRQMIAAGIVIFGVFFSNQQ